MTVAVVGTGISGLLVARLLHEAGQEVTLFEARDRLGGHTHTHHVPRDGGTETVDSGFIVFNERTYPNLTRLFELLDVESRASSMSFSVRDQTSGLEWCGWDGEPGRLFAQKRNLLRPAFWGMLADVLRFNRCGPTLARTLDPSTTLGEVLDEGQYGRAFREHYILPMGAAIWSSVPEQMLRFPAATFLRFFANHGMLSLSDRPVWRTVVGGSSAYIDPLLGPLREAVRLGTPVRSIRRTGDGAELTLPDGTIERFDDVVLALHSDQALALLADPTPAEREVLGALPYQANLAVLHRDERLLPRRRRAWAAWNYLVPTSPRRSVSVTYDMNILQGLEGDPHTCVTLNPCEPIDPSLVLAEMEYWHPVFDAGALAAQGRRHEVDGVGHTHYCGAYWRYGFHEDGVLSALHVARRFGVTDGVEVLATPRAAGSSAGDGATTDGRSPATPAGEPRTAEALG